MHVVPTFENDAIAAGTEEKPDHLPSMKVFSPFCFTFSYLSISAVWPVHGAKGWTADLSSLKGFRAREYYKRSLTPLGSGSWWHQDSSGGHTVLPQQLLPNRVQDGLIFITVKRG